MSKKEVWKKIIFPKRYRTNQGYEISSYGRVRNVREDGSIHLKKPVIRDGHLYYHFRFPSKLNQGERPQFNLLASHLVAKHFRNDYFKGCYVAWKDFNKLNNHYENLMCLPPDEARKRTKENKKNVKQKLVLPPDMSPPPVPKGKGTFKQMKEFPNYEINETGVVRRRVPPFPGRILSQRIHPDNLYIMDLIDRDGNRRTVYPHKEVAKLWVKNPNPAEKTIVIHKSEDSLNNHYKNLIWVSPAEALKHQFATGVRDNRKSWVTRKKLYVNGFKSSGRKKKAK